MVFPLRWITFVPEPEENSRGKVAAILVILALVGGSLFLVHRLSEVSAVQDCIATGQRNCGQ
jgi:hypothetical protein